MKVNSTIYKGIEYVQLSALPPEQKDKLLQTINHDLFIKILVHGKLVVNCLLFKDYEVWFENVYKAQFKQDGELTRKQNSPGVPAATVKKA
jgi:hypothetical protein